MANRPTFRGGRNLALKVPPHDLEATAAFYQDVLGLERLPSEASSAAFRFGALCLWIDRCPQLAQAELWLEVQADDIGAAAEHLAPHGVVRCDAIEPLPDGFQGFWIANAAGIVHLVAAPAEAPGL